MLGMLVASVVMASSQISLSRVNRIVMMGDSITQGGSGPKGYVTLVSQSLKKAMPGQSIEIVNAGISGQKAPDMLARFKKDVVDKQPQIVTLSVGVNDVWHNFHDFSADKRIADGNSGQGVPKDKYIADLEAMIDLAQKNSITIILVSPTLVYEDLDCAENKRVEEYIGAAERLAKRKRVQYINLHKVFKSAVSAYQKAAGKQQLLLTSDGVHMNDAGNALMAAQILRAMGVAIPDNIHP